MSEAKRALATSGTSPVRRYGIGFGAGGFGASCSGAGALGAEFPLFGPVSEKLGATGRDVVGGNCVDDCDGGASAGALGGACANAPLRIASKSGRASRIRLKRYGRNSTVMRPVFDWNHGNIKPILAICVKARL